MAAFFGHNSFQKNVTRKYDYSKGKKIASKISKNNYVTVYEKMKNSRNKNGI